ncbi:hypothetical protein Tco_1149583, partial [Tanacetum coccineum]
YGMDGPEDELEKVFWKCLRTMFEEPLSTDPIWSELGQQKIITTAGEMADLIIVVVKVDTCLGGVSLYLSVSRTSSVIFYTQISCSRIRTSKSGSISEDNSFWECGRDKRTRTREATTMQTTIDQRQYMPVTANIGTWKIGVPKLSLEDKVNKYTPNEVLWRTH